MAPFISLIDVPYIRKECSNFLHLITKILYSMDVQCMKISVQFTDTCFHQDAELQSEVIIQLKNCQTASNKLLSLSKLCVADPTTPHLKNNLTQSARSLTDSINNLLNACTSSVPGQKECDNAIRNLEVCLKFILNCLTFLLLQYRLLLCSQFFVNIRREVDDFQIFFLTNKVNLRCPPSSDAEQQSPRSKCSCQ